MFVGRVDHIQRHQGGHSEFEDLACQEQVSLQVRGVHDDHHSVRACRSWQQSFQSFHGDALIGSDGVQCIQSGKIDQSHRLATDLQLSASVRDGGPWEICGLGAKPRETIEKRRFAGVRVASQRNCEWPIG